MTKAMHDHENRSSIMSTGMQQTAAARREDVWFETARLAGKVKTMTYLAWGIILLVIAVEAVVLPLWFPGKSLWVMAAIDVGVIVFIAALQFCLQIAGVKVEGAGAAMIVRMRLSAPQYSLAGLQTIEADPAALKGAGRSFGNGGLGACSGYFRSKRMGAFTAYVTDMDRCVVLRWEKQCVVVSPADVEYFIAEVCKRTGARRLN